MRKYFHKIDMNIIEAITSDIFDTILLRRGTSEHSRLSDWSRIVSSGLKSQFSVDIPRPTLFETRRLIQLQAFRTTEIYNPKLEVKYSQVVSIIVEMFALPKEALQLFELAEEEVEFRSLKPNTDLLKELVRLRNSGKKIYAITDTIMSASFVETLLHRVVGSNPFERVFSSADMQATKRSGELFDMVAREIGLDKSKIIHIGDNFKDDVMSARRRGFQSIHIPRPKVWQVLRKVDGVLRIVPSLGKQASNRSVIKDKVGYGREIFGPILADFYLRLWVYLRLCSQNGKPVALFCARGGLPILDGFHRFITASGLSLPVESKPFMVSRLTVSRASLLRDAEGAKSELLREFRGCTMEQVIKSLSGNPTYKHVNDEPVTRRSLDDFLKATKTNEALSAIRYQSDLLGQLIRDLKGDADRLVLVDTGLYGSTLRMIMEGYPEEQWESVLFARSNYKGISNPHFSGTTGLVVEQDHYSPVNSRSSILRYWHVIEALFEPELASVRTYRRVDGQIVSNLEAPGWEDKIRQPDNLLLKGALRYLKSLSAAEIVLVSDRAQRSWRRLKSDILFPGRQALQILDAGERSVDFGRNSKVSAVSKPRKHEKPLSSVRMALWREGHMAAHMEPFAKVYQIGWEMLYCGRFMKRALLSSRSSNEHWRFWPSAIILSSTCAALWLAEG